MLPTQIGKYRVLRSLGHGAMGDVYLGEDPHIGRQVAIKVLRQEDPEGRLRFLQEARVVGAFSHPNIVVVHEFGFEGDEPFLAMEFLPGESLEIWLRQPRPLSAQLRVVRGLAEALDYAHARGVLHRDVKPGNVQVLPDGQCKLMDFGIARAALGRLTATGAVMGTPNYMAPETLSAASYSERSDVYSAGVVFYEMFAGGNPFAGPTVAVCLHNVLHAEPTPLARLRPDLPASLLAAVTDCLVKDPARRPASFARLLAAVQTVETGATAAVLAATRELPGDTQLLTQQTTTRRATSRRALLGLAAIVLVGAGALWWSRGGTAPAPSSPPLPAATPAVSVAPPATTLAPEPSPLPSAPATPGGERKVSPPPLRPSATPIPKATPATPVLDASSPPATLPSAPPSAAPSAPASAAPSAAPTPRPSPSAATPVVAGPMLSALKPRYVRRGEAVRIEVLGSGFGPSLKLLVLHGGRPATGLRVTNLHVRDSSRVTATLIADSDVNIDSYVVVASDGAALSNGLTLEVQL